MTYQIKLNAEEFLTTASFSPSGKNFAIGTSLGDVILGKTDGNNVIRVARLLLCKNNAVTSIQLS